MEKSILTSTKKLLGIEKEYVHFDLDILTHINSALDTLHQLGVGPSPAVMIEDAEAEWDTFFEGNKNISSVKSYIFARVRLLFDPPTTSFAIDALKTQILELEWRLNVEADKEAPV